MINIPSIVKLEEEERALSVQLDKVRTAIRLLKNEAHYEKWKVWPNETLISYRGKVFQFSRWSTFWENLDQKPWAQGRLRKKDGSFSTTERCLFSDWTVL